MDILHNATNPGFLVRKCILKCITMNEILMCNVQYLLTRDDNFKNARNILERSKICFYGPRCYKGILRTIQVVPLSYLPESHSALSDMVQD